MPDFVHSQGPGSKKETRQDVLSTSTQANASPLQSSDAMPDVQDFSWLPRNVQLVTEGFSGTLVLWFFWLGDSVPLQQ